MWRADSSNSSLKESRSYRLRRSLGSSIAHWHRSRPVLADHCERCFNTELEGRDLLDRHSTRTDQPVAEHYTLDRVGGCPEWRRG